MSLFVLYFLSVSRPARRRNSMQPHFWCLHFWISFQVFPPAIDKGKHLFTWDFAEKEGKHSCVGFVKGSNTLLTLGASVK